MATNDRYPDRPLGSTLPPFTARLANAGVALNLAAAGVTVTIRMRKLGASGRAIDDVAATSVDASGNASYTPTTAQVTDGGTGDYEVQWVYQDAGGLVFKSRKIPHRIVPEA